MLCCLVRRPVPATERGATRPVPTGCCSSAGRRSSGRPRRPISATTWPGAPRRSTSWRAFRCAAKYGDKRKNNKRNGQPGWAVRFCVGNWKGKWIICLVLGEYGWYTGKNKLYPGVYKGPRRKRGIPWRIRL